MKVNMVLFLCLALIQITDIGITMIVLGYGGVELNPIMAFLMNKFGDAKTLIFIKAFLLFIIFIGVVKNVRYIRAGLITTCSYYVIGLGLSYLFL
jgi:hypothetical protein